MATTVGALKVSLGLGTGVFTAGTKQADASLSNFGKRISSTKALLVGLAGAAGIGLVIRRLSQLVREQLTVVDAMAKLSDRTGFATEELAALSLAARIAGSDEALLNKSLEIFTRRLGEVKLGTGEAKRALDALGLSLDDLLAASPFEAFRRVSDAISNMETQAEKAAAANFLFGRSGAQLVNLFDGGAAAIDRAADEAERFGTAISRADAAKVEEANDAMTRLGELFTGIIRQITIEMAPALEEFTESLARANEAGGGFAKTFSFALNTITVLWEGLNAGVGFWLALQARVFQAMAKLASLLPVVGDEAETLAIIFGEIADAGMERFIDGGDRVIDILNGVQRGAKDATAAVDGLNESISADVLGQFEPGGLSDMFDFGAAFDDFLADGLPVNINADKLFEWKDNLAEIADDFTERMLGNNKALERGSQSALSFLRSQQNRQPLKTLEQIAKEQLAALKEIARKQQAPPPVAVIPGL